jgi:hypothetical protein
MSYSIYFINYDDLLQLNNLLNLDNKKNIHVFNSIKDIYIKNCCIWIAQYRHYENDKSNYEDECIMCYSFYEKVMHRFDDYMHDFYYGIIC